jgi:acetoin utilization deacetylase AcuC-like enzyme
MTAAVLHAARTRETTFSPTSGAHHAKYREGGGYCTFNFLALAAVEAHEAGFGNIGIVDCDMHYGDGTDDIIRRRSLDYVRHYSFGGDWLAGRDTSARWLMRLPEIVGRIARDVSVIIYNAGADPHIDDPLGGVLTTEQLKRRDEIVFETARRFDVPVAVSLAGGYQRPLRCVLDVHDNTFSVACRLAGEVRREAVVANA